MTSLARVDLRGRGGDVHAALAPPPPQTSEPPSDGTEDGGVAAVVRDVIAEVRRDGDGALRRLTERFDGCSVSALRVDPDDLERALDGVSAEFRAALEYAREEITAYHSAQVEAELRVERAGVSLQELVVPVDRAGLYVPGGRATYPSTVLMTAIPARAAGVRDVVLCVPPGPDGEIPAPTLAAAALVGVDEVYRVGGAQAIAALAYGTATIRPVDVIVGPGNAYVTEAKRQVVGVVGIDALAGPSEVVVVADDTAPAELVAADLLAQAEHGPGGVAALVTWSEAVAAAVERAVTELTEREARRDEIRATLAHGGRVVLVDGPAEAMAAANVIAPEHLELVTADPEALVPLVRNAGAVFVGPWAPAVVGDYVAGVNHVLPTARTARFASALRVADFQKRIHVVTVDEAAFARLAPHARAFAAVEGLNAHGRSVALRQVGEGV